MADEVKAIPWLILSFPAEATEDSTCVGPLSGKVWERKAGDILWPSREGPTELANMRASMKEYAYSGQYQQNPVPLGGNMFDPKDWRYYDALPDRIDKWWTSWDMTFTDSARSDFVVGQVWCAAKANKYLVDQFRKRCDLPASRAAVLSMKARYTKCSAHVVEGKANGKGIIADLRSTVTGLQDFNPDQYGDKIERANLVLDEVRSGNVLLPTPAVHKWVKEFVDRAAAFPFASHDDEIDAMTQSLIWYGKRRLTGMPGSVGSRESYWGK